MDKSGDHSLELDDTILGEVKYLSFFLANEQFAIDLSTVIEIISFDNIKIIPSPSKLPFITGISHINDEIIAIVDMRILLHMDNKAYVDKSVVIVVLINDKKYGIIVDNVFDIFSFNSNAMKKAPAHYLELYVEKIAVIGEDIFLILDIKKMFSDKKIGPI